jgi:hypothetical protein
MVWSLAKEGSGPFRGRVRAEDLKRNGTVAFTVLGASPQDVRDAGNEWFACRLLIMLRMTRFQAKSSAVTKTVTREPSGAISEVLHPDY